MAMPSGRFFGWVIGGTLPAALAADWLVSAWDQNTGMRFATPGTAAAEQAAAGWLLDLLGLPADADVGFVTGATMANFTGLAAGRRQQLDGGRLGRRPARAGRRPAGAGAGRRRAARDARRWRCATSASARRPWSRPTPRAGCEPDALAEALAAGSGPAIVCLQAGNLHSGAFDPIGAGHRAGPRARRLGARGRRVRAVGGGLAAAAAPGRRARGCRLLGDRRAQDPQRARTTAGSSSCRRPALRAAMGMRASYLVQRRPGDPVD